MTDYRDVSPKDSRDPLAQVKDVLKYIFHYLKHPIQQIAHLPDWNWTVLVLTLIGVSMTSGVLAGFIPPNFYLIVAGFVISPFVGLVTTFVGTLFMYYYFQVFEKRTVSLRRLFTLILFANIPFFIFQTASEVVPPITLVGFAFTSLLLAVGLTENFQMEKRRAIRLVAAVFTIVFLIWLVNRIDIARMDRF